MTPLKYAFDAQIKGSGTSQAECSEGGLAYVTPEAITGALLGQLGRRITPTGLVSAPAYSIALCTIGAGVGKSALIDEPYITNPQIVSLVPGSRVQPHYAAYLLKAMFTRFQMLAHQGVIPYSTPPILLAEKGWLPPRLIQEQIANFLDEQTARIDALIAMKTELVEKLQEMGQSAISARILGEDLPSQRKSTNVSEIGSIPSHWQLLPMMRLTDPARPIMYGIVLPGPNIVLGPSVPIVKGGDVRPHRLKLELLNRTTPEIEAPYARARLAEGDIVYSIRGTIGDAELVPAELAGANITQDVARIAPRVGIEPRWLLYAAKARPVFAQLEQLSLGAAVKGINIFDIKRARVPTPPVTEQIRIADELGALTARLVALRQHTLEHIDRLREYRSSLISAAVTGQLDIGTFQRKPVQPA